MKSYDIAVLPGKSGPKEYVLPFYSAEEHTALENKKGPYSVIEILKEVFNEDFKAALDAYLALYPQDAGIAAGMKGIADPRVADTGEPKAECNLAFKTHNMPVDLFFDNALIEAYDPAEGERRLFAASFVLRYVIDMGGRRCSAPLICPLTKDYVHLAPDHGCMSGNAYMIPVMRAGDYKETARVMLEYYYPEVFEAESPVDGYALARRMRISTKRVRFPEEINMMGRYFFSGGVFSVIGENGEPGEITVKPRTLLVNTELCPTPETENSTVLHECSHAFLDDRFFMLQALSGRPYPVCAGRSPSGYCVKPNGRLEWMELHASKLPAYILMEETRTYNAIEELYDDSGWDRSPANVMSIVEKLAARFGVSKAMAKYRMIEVGFPEAEGVYCFENDKRIPDHGCSENWKEGTTYTISFGESSLLLDRSPKFRSALQSGHYTYVEAHYCLNSGKYIRKDINGKRRLTDYARNHIDECCISFTVSGRYTNVEYIEGCAARKPPATDRYMLRHDMSAEPGTGEFDRQCEAFIADMKRWDELLRNLPDEFPDAVVRVVKAKNMSMEDLADEIGVSRPVIYKWLGQKRVSLRHVVGICVALSLRADIGVALVEKAGYTFRKTDEDMLLRGMVFHSDIVTIASANALLEKKKLPRLVNGKGGTEPE